MSIPIIGTIIEKVVSVVDNFQNNRAKAQQRADELKDAKHQAKVDRIKRGDEAEADYDRIAQENARSTYIDEIMIIWILGIVTCLFIPPLAPYAIAGFTALKAVPLWFQLIVVGAFISKLGLRFLFTGRTLFGSKLK